MKRSLQLPGDEESRNKKQCKESAFKITPIQKFWTNKSPYYRQPNQLGYFSLDGSRKFCEDSSQLRYYVEPLNKNLNFNLREGYKTCVEKDDDIKERLTHLLTWISKNRSRFCLDKKDDVTHNNR